MTLVLCYSARQFFTGQKRSVWFVYSGMGSQWPGMGADLMKIPVFAAAIERCHQALQPLGLDLKHIVTTTDPSIYDNILHSFVGIAAVQVNQMKWVVETMSNPYRFGAYLVD